MANHKITRCDKSTKPEQYNPHQTQYTAQKGNDLAHLKINALTLDTHIADLGTDSGNSSKSEKMSLPSLRPMRIQSLIDTRSIPFSQPLTDHNNTSPNFSPKTLRPEPNGTIVPADVQIQSPDSQRGSSSQPQLKLETPPWGQPGVESASTSDSGVNSTAEDSCGEEGPESEGAEEENHAFNPNEAYGPYHQYPPRHLSSPQTIYVDQARRLTPESYAYQHQHAVLETLQRHTRLFEGLELICRNAAAAYWHSQSENTLNPRLPLRPARGRYRPQQEYPYSVPHFVADQHLGLADFVACIAQLIWDRAMITEDHAGELEAVHRMGNLYAWGERVTSAARGEMGVASAEETYRVVMAARDLVSWLLNEDAKREIEVLWREWAGIGA
ncbi:hypothetical protein MMC25_000133 [Agyrium rufum]|nr:hypothetical protein [Agyrium rufum]